MSVPSIRKRGAGLFALSVLSLAAMPAIALAQGFVAIASPPRFELNAKPGEAVRSILEISNPAPATASYTVRTADWSFDSKRNLLFHETPQAESCRPWVALEQREIKLAASGRMRFRFEVQVPAGTAPRECRFALMIEGSNPLVQRTGNIAFPVSGRLGVIVYVAVGGAQPQLEIIDAGLIEGQSGWVPTISVKNTGLAHGRLAGFLDGTDASGKRYDFGPATVPILPGDTRDIALHIERDGDNKVAVTYPLTIGGKLEWGRQSTRFEHRFVVRQPAAPKTERSPSAAPMAGNPGAASAIAKTPDPVIHDPETPTVASPPPATLNADTPQSGIQ